VGPVGEEGVANIVNAFVEAGAQTVVSTLWELEDHATAHLMTVFYDHLGRAEGKGQSLREAQLQMIASGDPPYFWAGFEVVGDPTGSLFNASPAYWKAGTRSLQFSRDLRQSPLPISSTNLTARSGAWLRKC
jgi:CHAT domain